jgi:hypothetical protein
VTDFKEKLPFVKLVAALEVSMRNGDGDAIMKDAAAKRRREAYERAKELLTGVRLSVEEVEKIAA